MKQRIFHIFCLFTYCLFVPSVVNAELSVTNQWRIEQASHRCSKTDNTLTFPEYWRDTVTDENRETVCMAEQFAKLSTDEGEGWLNNKGVEFIRQCKVQSDKDDAKYYSCLQMGLKKITTLLSSPCKELGEEGLWDENRCRRLVSYIFVKDFDKLMLANRSFAEKVMDNKILPRLFNPIVAIIFLLLYVLDMVMLTDPGNWWRVPKFGFIVGAIILGSWFFQDKLGFVGMGLAVFICVGGMIRNHIIGRVKPKKKKTKYSRR